MSIKIVYGDEPYIIDKVVQGFKENIKFPELNLNIYEEICDTVKISVETMPLMDEKRLVILNLNEIKGEDVLKLVKDVPDSTDLVIISKVLDQRTALYKKAKKEQLLKECCKLTEPQLKTFVFKLLEKNATKITNSAYGMLSKRMNYFDDPDVSLYTVEIFVKQLCLLNKVITEEEIQNVLKPTSNEKTYRLTNFILIGHSEKSFALAQEFIDRGENPIGLLSMMQKIFRLGYKASLYKEVNKAEIGKMLGEPVFKFQDALNIPEDKLNKVLDIIQDAISGIKTGKCESKNMFLISIGKMISVLN